MNKLPLTIYLSYLFISITICLVAFQAIKLVATNPQINLYSDWPGHMDKAKKLDWPWRGGWDTTFWGGYPTVTYPNFSHAVLRMYIEVTKSDGLAVLFTCLTVFSLQIAGIISLGKKIIPKKRLLRTVYIIGTITAFYYIPGEQLGSFIGTLITGGIAAGFAIAFLFFYLASSNPYKKAVWIGLVLLTHTLTAFFIMAIALIELVFTSIAKAKHHIHFKKDDFIPLMGGLIIGSPWIAPFLDPSFQGVTINMGGDLFTILTPIAVISIAIMIEYEVYGILFIALILSALFTIAPHPVTYWLQQQGLHGIHFYRFQILFLFILIASISHTIALRKRTDIKTGIFIVTSLLCIISLIKDPFGKASVKFIKNQLPRPDQLARVMDVSGLNQTGNFMRTAEHELVKSSSFVGTAGLFYESSPHGPLYYSLGKLLNPSFFASGTLSSFFQEYATDSAKLDAIEAMEVLGINYISFYSAEPYYDFGLSTATIGGIRFIDRSTKQLIDSDWYLEKVTNSPLIASLGTLPKTDQSINLGAWWFDNEIHPSITREYYVIPDNLDMTKPDISDIHITPTSINFNVLSDKQTPVIVKFAQNRYWRNRTNPLQKPLWITPGYMFLFAQGPTQLTWSPPLYITECWVLSLFTLFYCLSTRPSKKTS